jgi:hypothetical protein
MMLNVTRRLGVGPVLLMLALSACGGSSEPNISSAAPATVICGKTLNATASGAVVEDATRNHRTIDGVSSRGLIFIRVSESCETGAEVVWAPKAAATLVDQALARDGHSVVVVLRPANARATFALTASRSGKRVAYATVRLR